MPYLAFDLDAKKLVPQVAKSAGVQTADVGWGLLELWDFVWSKKTATVDTLVLTGCFGPNDRVIDALVSYGFLEPDGDDFRVRGAERYLRVAAARSEGGKKSAGNLKRGNKAPEPPAGAEPGKSPGSLPAPAGDQPEGSRGGFPALTASSEQRASNALFAGSAEADPPKKKPKADKPADPRHAPTVKALTDIGFSFRGGHHAKVVTELLALGGSLEAVVEAGRRALAHKGYPTVRALPELLTHWDHFKPPPKPPPRTEPAFSDTDAPVLWGKGAA